MATETKRPEQNDELQKRLAEAEAQNKALRAQVEVMGATVAKVPQMGDRVLIGQVRGRNEDPWLNVEVPLPDANLYRDQFKRRANERYLQRRMIPLELSPWASIADVPKSPWPTKANTKRGRIPGVDY